MIKRRDMMTDIAGYFKKNLKKGYTKESLKWALINQGYSRIEVDKAIRQAEEELASEAPMLKSRPEIERKVEPVSEEPKKGFWKKLFG
jgi:hypothetical protein